MHDKGVIRSDLEEASRLSATIKLILHSASHLQWDLPSPNREVVSVLDSEFARDRGDMVNEAKILEREKLRRWYGIYVEVWKWKASSLLPTFNLRLDFRSP
jgi:hypothetical protein